MGGSFSAVLEPLQSVAKSVGDGLKGIKLPDNPLKDVSLGNKGRSFVKGVGDGLKGIKLPDNPLKDVSLGNKGRNFLKGVSSGIIGPRKARVQVSTGPFGFGRATQLRSVSSTPYSVSGLLGEAVGHTVSQVGKTGTKSIFSNSKKPSLFNKKNTSTTPSFVERMKQKFKPNNIKTSNISQTQPLEKPPQQIQEELPPQIKGGSKKKLSENKKNPSENKKKPSKKEKKPSGNKKNPSENKKKPSKKEKKPSGNKKKSKK